MEVKDVVVTEFVPDEDQANEIAKEVDQQNKEGDKEQEPEPEEIKAEDIDIDTLLQSKDELVSKHKIEGTWLHVEEYEKDDDTNFHTDFIASAGNLRAIGYKLKPMDWLEVKLKAGRIVPALATTTACCAGLQSLELIKVMALDNVEKFRSTFLNLSIPMVQASEPGAPTKVDLTPDLEVDSCWERWDIDKGENVTLREVIAEMRGLEVQGVMTAKWNEVIYMTIDGQKSTSEEEQVLNSTVRELTNSEGEDYVDLQVTCYDPISEERKLLQGVPPVRVIFRHE